MIRLSQIGQPRPAEPAPAPVVVLPPPMPLATILAAVAQEFGVSVEALRGPVRVRPLPEIRGEFCRRARALPKVSTTMIGRALNRDHTSVLYLLGRLERKPSWTEDS